MKNNLFVRILMVLVVYLGLSFFGGDMGRIILYPVRLLVTFLHEFGHALGALFTGGSVEALQINQDGSGFTMTRGGSRSIILMGGYIGSALLGNLLFYIGARGQKLAKVSMYILTGFMVISGILWYNSLYTTGFLLVFALVLFFLANKADFDREVLMFLGLASIIYIVQDFNVGPRSDLEKYAELMVFIPVSAWMYIWLGVVLILTALNIRMIWRIGAKEYQA